MRASEAPPLVYIYFLLFFFFETEGQTEPTPYLWYIGSVVFTIVAHFVETIHLLFQIIWTFGYCKPKFPCVTDHFIVEKSAVDFKINVIHMNF